MMSEEEPQKRRKVSVSSTAANTAIPLHKHQVHCDGDGVDATIHEMSHHIENKLAKMTTVRGKRCFEEIVHKRIERHEDVSTPPNSVADNRVNRRAPATTTTTTNRLHAQVEGCVRKITQQQMNNCLDNAAKRLCDTRERQMEEEMDNVPLPRNISLSASQQSLTAHMCKSHIVEIDDDSDELRIDDREDDPMLEDDLVMGNVIEKGHRATAQSLVSISRKSEHIYRQLFKESQPIIDDILRKTKAYYCNAETIFDVMLTKSTVVPHIFSIIRKELIAQMRSPNPIYPNEKPCCMGMHCAGVQLARRDGLFTDNTADDWRPYVLKRFVLPTQMLRERQRKMQLLRTNDLLSSFMSDIMNEVSTDSSGVGGQSVGAATESVESAEREEEQQQQQQEHEHCVLCDRLITSWLYASQKTTFDAHLIDPMSCDNDDDDDGNDKNDDNDDKNDDDDKNKKNKDRGEEGKATSKAHQERQRRMAMPINTHSVLVDMEGEYDSSMCIRTNPSVYSGIIGNAVRYNPNHYTVRRHTVDGRDKRGTLYSNTLSVVYESEVLGFRLGASTLVNR